MLLDFVPKPPHWSLQWDTLVKTYSWLNDLRFCQQDLRHHAEGDVLTHTEMVVRALLANPEWRELTERERSITFIACLMHDIAKPITRKVEDDGRITHKNHSPIGEKMARIELWHENVPYDVREEICTLIRHHQVPFYLIGKEANEAKRFLIEFSILCSNKLLYLVTLADGTGRICENQASILENVHLFRVMAEDKDCYVFDRPFFFANDHSRVLYFNRPDIRDPHYQAYDDTECEVIVLTGFPGSGKSTYAKTVMPDTPVVSMDTLRFEMDIEVGSDEMGTVKQAALEKAREYFRKKQTFIWDATCLSRMTRSKILSLANDYHAWIKIVYLDRPLKTLLANNKSREEKRIVPVSAIEKMMDFWEPPTLLECHHLELK